MYCETTAREQAWRNRERGDRDRVPAAAIRRMVERWSVPTLDEAHRVTYVIDGERAVPTWPPR